MTDEEGASGLGLQSRISKRLLLVSVSRALRVKAFLLSSCHYFIATSAKEANRPWPNAIVGRKINLLIGQTRRFTVNAVDYFRTDGKKTHERRAVKVLLSESAPPHRPEVATIQAAPTS